MLLCGDYKLALLLSLFHKFFNLIQIIVPILLLVMVIFDLTKLVINPEDKKRLNVIKNKCIAVVIIFFLPLIVSVFMNLVDEKYDFAQCYNASPLMLEDVQSTEYISVHNGEAVKILQGEEYEHGSAPVSNGSYSHNVEMFMKSVQNTVEYARVHNYHYGNSHASPPTSDGIISCDRLISKALWDIGYTDQSPGGVVVAEMESYLMSHGWKKSTNIQDCKYGSAVLVGPNGVNGAPTHAFVCVSYNPNTGIMQTYDEGAEWRIYSSQPFTTDNWNQSLIYGIYNMQ